jgi:hypothetical protein
MANKDGRISGMNFTSRYVFVCDASKRHNRALANADSRSDYCVSTYPGTIADTDFTESISERGRRPVMVAGAQIGTLGNANMGADCYGRQIVDPYILPDH